MVRANERDVDQRRDQGGADEEADQQRAPGRRTTQRAAAGRAGPRPGAGAGRRRAAATAEPRRYQRPWSENTWTFGSAVANARITPASATPRNRAPTRSASRSVAAQPRRSTSGRAGGAAADHEQHGRDHRDDAERASASGRRRTNGMNSWPQVRSRSRGAGWVEGQDAGDQGDEERAAGRPSRPGTVRLVASGRPAAASLRLAPDGSVRIASAEHQADGEVDQRRSPASRRTPAPRRRRAGRARCRSPGPPRPRRAARRGARRGRGRRPGPAWPAPARRRRRPGGTGRSPCVGMS